MRPPVIVGYTRGAGASTLAAALHAVDGGLLGLAADIVVCRAGQLPPDRRMAGPAPLLAVLGTGGDGPSGFARTVRLPQVTPWVGRLDVRADAAAVLTHSPRHLPPELQQYAMALRRIAAAVRQQLHPGGPPSWAGEPDDDALEAMVAGPVGTR